MTASKTRFTTRMIIITGSSRDNDFELVGNGEENSKYTYLYMMFNIMFFS
ncbi:MAG: hypothetical protein JXA54_06010 [Candidatus Heimdallarchaeota archaeon]|nr:hypothetical protein [Candidatus Heimdallarchaeota archaeon]